MNWPAHREHISRYGVANWLRFASYRAAHRSCGYTAIRGMVLTVDDVDSRFLGQPDDLRIERLSVAQFAALAEGEDRDEYAVPSGAVDRGDWCFAARDGVRLSSFGWCSTQPVQAFGSLMIRCGPSWVYRYNAFTHPDYRGRRLHAYCAAHALEDAVGRGYGGLVGWVEVDNFASQWSVQRLGYRVFGTCRTVSLAGHRKLWRSAACESYGFELFERPAEPRG